MKKKSKIMYYKQNLIESKGNLSKTRKIVNEIINKTKVKTTIPTLATSTNASNPLDTVDTSNILNDHFVEIRQLSAQVHQSRALLSYIPSSLVQFYQKTFCKLICLILQNLMIHMIFQFRP